MKEVKRRREKMKEERGTKEKIREGETKGGKGKNEKIEETKER